MLTKTVPVIKNVNFNDENYDYCLIEIHSRKIKRLHLWKSIMKNIMNEKIIISWNAKEKINLEKLDNFRIKYQLKIYNQNK